MFIFLTLGLTVISVVAAGLVPAGVPYRDVDALALVLAGLASLSLLLTRLAPQPDGVSPDRPGSGQGSGQGHSSGQGSGHGSGRGLAVNRSSRASRWAALAGLAGTAVVVVVNALAGFEIGFIQWPPWIGVFICFTLGGLWVRVAATGIAALGVAGYLAFDREPATGALVTGIAMCFLIAAVAGDATRTRRAYVAAAHAEVLGRSREQVLVAERLLLEERSRLARELHDSLGHSVNVMVLQAGVGRRVFTENPEFAREALGSVETVGRGALEELDRLLRVLHPLEPGRDEEPLAPNLADLVALVDRIRATGRDVDLRVGSAEELRLTTTAAARALYRIVQEGLTNAVRHTSTGLISIEITQIAGDVVIEVGNPQDAAAGGSVRPIAGHGLINMRERARLEGGSFEAGSVDGSFRIRATLPMNAADARVAERDVGAERAAEAHVAERDAGVALSGVASTGIAPSGVASSEVGA